MESDLRVMKIKVHTVIVALAERGEYARFTYWCVIHARSDTKVGYRAKEMAYELAASRIKRRRTLGIPPSTWLKLTDKDCLSYARAIDKLVIWTTIFQRPINFGLKINLNGFLFISFTGLSSRPSAVTSSGTFQEFTRCTHRRHRCAEKQNVTYVTSKASTTNGLRGNSRSKAYFTFKT